VLLSATSVVGFWLKWEIFVAYAWFFWVLLSFTVVAHIARDWAKQAHDRWARDEQKTTLKRLHEQAELLPETVRTLPRADFLNQMGGYYEQCRLLAEKLKQESPTPVDALYAARKVLKAIAQMTRAYDDNVNNAPESYGASLMVYAPQGVCPTCDPWLVFVEPEMTADSFEGLLVLADGLKATAAAEVDDTVPSFALPVPKIENRGRDKKWRWLPGAPAAFLEKEFSTFSDTAAMATWVRENTELSSRIADDVDAYFKGHGQVTSMLAAPVFTPTASQDRDEWEVIAVLNLHWTNARVLSYEAAIDALAHVLYPFRVVLAELLGTQEIKDLLNELVNAEQRDLLANKFARSDE